MGDNGGGKGGGKKNAGLDHNGNPTGSRGTSLGVSRKARVTVPITIGGAKVPRGVKVRLMAVRKVSMERVSPRVGESSTIGLGDNQ